MLATAGYILASLTLSYSGESEVLHMPASLNNRLVEQPSLSLGMAGAIGYKCWGISVDSLFISSVDMVEKSFVMWICLQSATESIRTHFWLTLKPTLKPTQILTISVTMDTMCACFFPMNPKWAFTVFYLCFFYTFGQNILKKPDSLIGHFHCVFSLLKVIFCCILISYWGIGPPATLAKPFCLLLSLIVLTMFSPYNSLVFISSNSVFLSLPVFLLPCDERSWNICRVGDSF